MKEIEQLIGAIYEASQDPAAWEVVLEGLREAIDCRKIVMFSAPDAGATPDLLLDSGFAPAQIAEYHRQFATIDEWTLASQRKLIRPGAPVLSEELVSPEELVNTPFYADYLRRWDDLHGCGVNFRASSHFTVINAVRSPREGPFSDDALAAYRVLCPHIERALAISRRLEALTRRHEFAMSALDQLSHAVLVVDGAGRLLDGNSAGMTVLDRRDGFSLGRGDVVSAWTADDAKRLRLLVHRAVSGHGGGGMTVSRKGTELPYQVLVAPATGRLTGGRTGAAALFVGDSSGSCSDSSPLLAQLFGLTPAEARVLAHLGEGMSPEEIAENAGVSMHTVRAQIKALRRKTDQRRISDLVRLAAGSPASWTRTQLP